MRRSTRVRCGGGTWEMAATLIILGLGFRSAQSSPINRQVGISENVFITVQNDTYGNEQRVCSIDSVTYEDGDSIPTSSPCEHCICRPPGFACTIISCEYRPGCKALKRSNQCCPEYQCECEKDGKIYQNGEKILDNNNPCEVCYCQGGDVICAVIDCYWRSDCQPRYIENRCCPLYDHCPPPSHPGPLRPIQTLPTTTRRPTTLASVFPWANTTTTTVAPSVPEELSTIAPLAPLSTSAPIVASSVVPSEPTQENLVIPSQSQYEGAASPGELSTNAPVLPSGQISTAIPSVATATSSTSAVSQSSESPTQGQEPLSHVVGETEPEVQNLPPQNTEAATEAPVVISVNVQGAAELETSEAISPQSSVSEQTVDISPTTSNVLPIEPTPVQEIQAVQSTQIAQEQAPVAPSQEASPAEATVVAHDTEEIATAEPTKILETVEEAGPSSTAATVAPVDPSSESSAAINPSVIATSVLDPAVEPTILPTTISTVSQSDGLTGEIYDEKPVEPQTERPAPIEINSSPKPVQSLAQENAFSEPEKEEPAVATTAQSAYQDAPLPSEPVNELVETQNNELSVNDPNVQSTNLSAPLKESKPFLQHDIIIDPIEQNNELPAILAQQRPAESAEKDDTSLAAHLLHQNAPGSISRNDTPVIPQSVPVASGAVIQLLPDPTGIPAANLDETEQVQTSSPSPSHESLSIENNFVESVQNKPIEHDLAETTSGLPLAQNDLSNVGEANVASDDIAAATTVSSSSSVTDQALSDDVNTPGVDATEKAPEKLFDAPESPSIVSTNHETSFEDDILTTNSFPERTTDIYHDDAPAPEKVSGPVESQTASPVLSTDNDESAVTTVPSVLRDAPAVGEDKNVENFAENNKIVSDITETTSSPVLSDSVNNGDELTGDEGSGEEPEINNVVPTSADQVISILNSSNNNDEPVATTSSSVASDDVEINEEVNELLTTIKSVAVQEDAVQQDAENDEAVATATTRQPVVEISQVGDHQQEQQVVTESQLGQDIPSSLTGTLKLRLDPSVFTSGESSSNEHHDGANENIVKAFEPIVTTTYPIALNNDDDIATTQPPAVAISRQDDITTEPTDVTTESDIVFDIVGGTSSSAAGAPNELKSESIVEDSITTTEPSLLLSGDELRSHLTQYDNAIPTEQNIELTTTAGIISRERSDLDSAETINEETSTVPQQVRTKISNVVGSSITNESESESSTVELDTLNDEKVEGDDVASTTPQATLLLRHHHPDHHGFLIEETTRLPQQQEEEQQRQVEGNESTKEDDNRETLFRTFEVTTVLSEPEADEPASETTLSSKPDFRSDLDFDIITSSQSSALPGDGESNDPVNAASLSESQSNPNPSTESFNAADEPAQTTVLPALLDDDEDDATTVVVSIVEDDSTNIPERSRDSIPQDSPVPTTTLSPIELEDESEPETTVSSLDDIDDVVGTTTILTALDESENDTDATSPTASAIVDNRVPPELARKPNPIIDDLPANGVGRSDLSLQGQLKDEVNSADDTWFWRTVNRVRRLPDFFSVLSRKPRSTSSKPELQKPAKTKKATQFERKPIIRPFLFW